MLLFLGAWEENATFSVGRSLIVKQMSYDVNSKVRHRFLQNILRYRWNGFWSVYRNASSLNRIDELNASIVVTTIRHQANGHVLLARPNCFIIDMNWLMSFCYHSIWKPYIWVSSIGHCPVDSSWTIQIRLIHARKMHIKANISLKDGEQRRFTAIGESGWMKRLCSTFKGNFSLSGWSVMQADSWCCSSN